MPFIRGRRGERGRQVWRYGCRHCEVIEAYQAARDAWWALRESGGAAYGAAGASHSGAGYYQLSDEEFRELHPMPLFRDFLVQMARERRQEEEAESEGRSPWDVAWPA